MPSAKSKQKTYKFAQFREEAAKLPQADKPAAPPPFVIDDVQPPIVITAPDTLERQMGIGDLIDRDGMFEGRNALQLLRLLCGDEFGRVWQFFKNDTDGEPLAAFIRAVFEHFSSVLSEGADVPGGSVASPS